MDEHADDVAADEIVEPLVAAFVLALNTTFQVLVTRDVTLNREAKALLEVMAEPLSPGAWGFTVREARE